MPAPDAIFLQHFAELVRPELAPLLQARWQQFERPSQKRYRRHHDSLAKRRVDLQLGGPIVGIGHAASLAPGEADILQSILQEYVPWRKGPFSIFGRHIDAEWQSDRKFARLLPHLAPLKNAVIADVGANNGYYMFRLAHYQPKVILGLEPTLRHISLFNWLQRFAQLANVTMQPLAGEHLDLFPGVFDIILCLGVLYHYHDPIGMLRAMHTALRPGGQIIVESQVIPGQQSHALMPEKRYAKVPGTWFVPTAEALKVWLQRTGFTAVELLNLHPMQTCEQRRTAWMPFESYDDFIDAENPELTVEGYPAPWRAMLSGYRGK
jgi:tRNA (mo5U34)-methyltransferase